MIARYKCKVCERVRIYFADRDACSDCWPILAAKSSRDNKTMRASLLTASTAFAARVDEQAFQAERAEARRAHG